MNNQANIFEQSQKFQNRQIAEIFCKDFCKFMPNQVLKN